MTIDELQAEGYWNLREVPGRGICGTYRFMFTFGVCWGIDNSGYRGRWCFATRQEAETALADWDGEGDPPGSWLKYKGEGGERSPLQV